MLTVNAPPGRDHKTPSSPTDEDQLTDETDEKALRSFQEQPWPQYLSSCGTLFLHVRPQTWREWGEITFAFIATMSTHGFAIIKPLTLRAVVDNSGNRGTAIFAYVAFDVAEKLANSLCWVCKSRLKTRWELNLERYSFSRALQLSADYHINKSASQTIEDICRGGRVIDTAFTISFNILPSVFELIMMMIIIPKVFEIRIWFVTVVTTILEFWLATRHIDPDMYRRYVRQWSRKGTLISEALTHWRRVSEKGSGKHEEARLKAGHHRTLGCYESLLAQRLWLMVLGLWTERSGLFLVLWPTMVKDANVGGLVMLVMYWDRILQPAATVANGIDQIVQGLMDMEKLTVLLSQKPSVADRPNAQDFEFRGGRVEWHNCSFVYPNGFQALKNVSFVVEPGQKIALVGKTGSGKSTIIQLMCRLYDVTNGVISVDNQDIRNVRLCSYRPFLDVIAQQPGIFSDSFRYNLTYPDAEVDPEDMTKACKKAKIHDKISRCKHQYDENLGGAGEKLSGGEKQRVAIAGVLLKSKAKILLLDEITSGVDRVTEQGILEALDEEGHDKTMFVVTHRLHTIRNADQILVFDEGQIVERGKHNDLVRLSDGHYRHLWEAEGTGI